MKPVLILLAVLTALAVPQLSAADTTILTASGTIIAKKNHSNHNLGVYFDTSQTEDLTITATFTSAVREGPYGVSIYNADAVPLNVSCFTWAYFPATTVTCTITDAPAGTYVAEFVVAKGTSAATMTVTTP